MARALHEQQPTIIAPHPQQRGLIAGLLGCALAILGIFTIGAFFVPLAAMCALVGLWRGVSGANAAGIGTSLLAGALTVLGFIVSPSLWVVLGAALVETSAPTHTLAGSASRSFPHEVSVQFATGDGQPMTDADVKVFAPGDLTHPVQTGRADKNGKFEFGTDRGGIWTAEARRGAEVARVSLRVGSAGSP